MHRCAISALRAKYPNVQLPLLYNEIFQPQAQPPAPVPVAQPVSDVVLPASPIAPASPVELPVVVHAVSPVTSPVELPSTANTSFDRNSTGQERLSPEIISPDESVSFGELNIPDSVQFNFGQYSPTYANIPTLEVNPDLNSHIQLQVCFIII